MPLEELRRPLQSTSARLFVVYSGRSSLQKGVVCPLIDEEFRLDARGFQRLLESGYRFGCGVVLCIGEVSLNRRLNGARVGQSAREDAIERCCSLREFSGSPRPLSGP